MADFYLDTSAVGNEYQAYAATPTWGAGASDKPLPMDGNGKAGPGHAAAVAIAEIQINALPADGNTLVIAGATLTAKTAAAAKNQWTLGASVSACATNLVALINTFGTGTAQCDATVSTSACKLALPLPRWAFARVKPGASDTVQIATRIAGADLNHAANSFVAITQSGWGTPPTFTQFAGGADGPFGYFWANETVFGKTITTSSTTPGYGISVVAAPGPAEPAYTDPIHVRTRRGGVDLSAVFGQNSMATITFAIRTFIFDDGTVWAGDAGRFTLRSISNTGAGSSVWMAPLGGLRMLARAKYGLRVVSDPPGAQKTLQITEANSASGPRAEWLNVLFDESFGSNNGVISLPAAGNTSYRVVTGCKFVLRSSAGRSFGGTNNNSSNFSFRYYDCDFEYVVAGPTPTGLFSYSSNASSPNDSIFELSRCRFTFASGGPITQLVSYSSGSTSTGFRVLVTDCTGIKPDLSPLAASEHQYGRMQAWIGCYDTISGLSARSHHIDTGHHQSTWQSDGTFPTLNSQTPTAVPWAIRALIKSGRQSAWRTELARLTKVYRAADAAAVLTVELLVPAGVVFNRAQLGADITFVDAGGEVVHASTLQPWTLAVIGTASALSASAATWTAQGSRDAVKLTLDTSTLGKTIKSGTEIVATIVHLGNTPGDVDRTVFIHPEIDL